ncbi:MAG: hypothetical protein Q8L23_15935 [Caulobacter sp.]|nr:hypothetical protein [Caulobacter sp.]
MPAPAWPSTDGFTFALADGFGETFPELASRTDNATGPANQRRTATSGLYEIDVAYILTSAEREVLREFHRTDAAGGAVWFDWTDPVTQTTVSARFLVGKPPSYAPYKPDWIARVTLEVVRPIPEPA